MSLQVPLRTTRLDTLPSATNDPGRFISGIYVDPANPNHAWVSYGSYSTLTPGFAGHVFEVTYNPATPDATWTSLDGSGATAFPDFPANDVVRDSNGDLYVSNDWGVLRLREWIVRLGRLLELVFRWLKSQVLRSCPVRGSYTQRRMGAVPGS